MREACVYRAFDAEDRLLYVGCCYTFKQRKNGHQQRSKWYKDAVRWTVETFPTRRAADEEEFRAIREEGPIHNQWGLVGKRRNMRVPSAYALRDEWVEEQRAKFDAFMADPQTKPIKSLETWRRWVREGCPGVDD